MDNNHERTNFTLEAIVATNQEAELDLSDDPYDDPIVTFEVVTRLEDLIIDLVEKIYLDMLLHDSSQHSTVMNQADHILNKITLELEHLNAKLLDLMSSVVKDLIYIKNQPVSTTEDGLLLLEEFSQDTTSKQHGDLPMEERVKKLALFVKQMQQCTENFAVAGSSKGTPVKKSGRIFDIPECEECRNHEVQEIQSSSKGKTNAIDETVSIIMEPGETVQKSISKLSSSSSTGDRSSSADVGVKDENSYQAIGGRISETELSNN